MKYYHRGRSPESAAYWAQVLASYVPSNALSYVSQIMRSAELELHLSRPRTSKLGHFRAAYNGRPQSISINSDLSSQRFLLTLIHELAHLFTHQEYGSRVSPHGAEWKRCFQQLMTPLLCEEVFEQTLLPHVIHHLNNPKASSCVDRALHRRFELLEGKSALTVADIEEGAIFSLENGRVFERGKKRRTRYLCYALPGRKPYLVHGAASVADEKPVLSPT